MECFSGEAGGGGGGGGGGGRGVGRGIGEVVSGMKVNIVEKQEVRGKSCISVR